LLKVAEPVKGPVVANGAADTEAARANIAAITVKMETIVNGLGWWSEEHSSKALGVESKAASAWIL
jgi:hypothetical protein